MKNIFIDIDGTIFDHSAHRIHQTTLDALAKLSQDNTLWLCTGRAYKTAKLDLGIPIDNYVCALGAMIYKDAKPIYERPYTKEELDIVSTKAKELGLSYGYDCTDHTYRPMIVYRRMLARVGKAATDGYWANIDEYDGSDVYKITVESPTGDVAAYDRFVSDLSDRFELCATANASMLASEVSPKGISKGGAIKKLMEQGLFRQEDTICIGDSPNDISMFKVCAISIAMGQGHEDAKKEATYVTDDIGKDGFYNAFKRLKLI